MSSPAAAARRCIVKDEDGGFYHFVQVTVDGDKVSAEVVDVNGKVRDRF